MIRSLAYTLVVLLVGVQTFGQGVAFVSGNLRTPFTLAKAQKKSVFVEVYSPTCHICEGFVPTFKDTGVGAAFNGSFVSYKLDVNSPEGQAFLAKQKIFVQSLPLMLFFDSDVRLLHAQQVNNTKGDLIALAKTAADPNKRAAAYGKRFAKGDKEPGFLIDYGYFSRVIRDTAANIQAMNAYAKVIPAAQYGNNDSYIVLQKVLMDAENPLFAYFINHLPQYKSKHPAQEVTTAGETIVMSTLYSSRGNLMPYERLHRIGTYLERLGQDTKTVQNRTLIPELNALVRSGQWARVVERINQYERLASPGGSEYSYLSGYLRSKSTNPQVLQKVAMMESKIRR